MRRGLTPLRFLGLMAAAAAAFWTKNTTWPLLVIVPIALLFGLPWHSRRIPWALLLGGTFLALTWAVRWGDPALWAHGDTSLPMRDQVKEAPFGTHAFRFAPQQAGLTQWLPIPTAQRLKDKPTTIGVWLWSEEPTTISLPKLCSYEKGCTKAPTVKIDRQPHFFAIQATLPSGKYPRLVLPISNQTKGEIYADGVVLVEGIFDTKTAPTPSADGKIVYWDGQTLTNAARNSSAEHGRFYLNPILHKYLTGRFPASTDIALATFLDPWGTATYQKALYSTLFCTFWGRLARNKVDLLGSPPLYYFLLILSLVGTVGSFLAAWHYHKSLPWDALIVLLLSMALPWATTAFRGLGTMGRVIPWARYASAGIFPTAVFLCSGWYFWIKTTFPKIGITIQQGISGMASLFLTLWVAGWLSLINRFHLNLHPWIFILLYTYLFILAAQWLTDSTKPYSTDQGSNK